MLLIPLIVICQQWMCSVLVKFLIVYMAIKMFLTFSFTNIRRIAENKGTSLALLSVTDLKFDIVILSEIGDDGNNCINDHYFSDYNFYMDLPNNNKYGGVVVMMKRDYGSVTQRDYLKHAT